MAGRFGAVVTAMVTPFRDDHGLDLDAARSLAAHLYERGSESLVIAGSTGESPTLTHREKLDLFEAVIDAAKGKGKVLCGTGTYNTAETLELSREAEELGADGLLLVTPYYNKPPQRGLLEHFTQVANAVSIPVVAYNIPGRTGTRIEHDTLLRIAEVPNIVGVKDSTGDFQWISRLISEVSPDFEVYSGDDAFTLPLLSVGAVGVISVASHWAAGPMNEMITAFLKGDVERARELNARLIPSWNYESGDLNPNPIPTKALLRAIGQPAGQCRLPLGDAPDGLEERGLAVWSELHA